MEILTYFLDLEKIDVASVVADQTMRMCMVACALVGAMKKSKIFDFSCFLASLLSLQVVIGSVG